MMDAFDQLTMERRRTLFVLYGWRRLDGTKGGAYSKLAHSLGHALDDLHENPGVSKEWGPYLVKDAFIEEADPEDGEEAGAILHVDLISGRELLEDGPLTPRAPAAN